MHMFFGIVAANLNANKTKSEINQTMPMCQLHDKHCGI